MVISEKGEISTVDKKVQNGLAISLVYNSWVVEYLYLGHLPQTCKQEVLIAPTIVGSRILLQHIPQSATLQFGCLRGQRVYPHTVQRPR